MKYSFMSFSAPQSSLGELLEMAARYGYAGIEPRIDSKHAHGIELDTSAARRQAIRAQAEASGIALCCVAVSCRYADPATAAGWVEQTRRAIELAADIGSPRLRVFGGQLDPQLSRPDAISLVSESLASVANDAQAHGVTICMETHDDWTHPMHVADVMLRVKHPNIAVNWDYQHTTRVAKVSVDDAFNTLKPWIQHVHFHDGTADTDKLVFLPIGQGVYDNKRVLELLTSVNYDGFISGEWINWEPYEIHLPREIAAMQALEAQIG